MRTMPTDSPAPRWSCWRNHKGALYWAVAVARKLAVASRSIKQWKVTGRSSWKRSRGRKAAELHRISRCTKHKLNQLRLNALDQDKYRRVSLIDFDKIPTAELVGA